MVYARAGAERHRLRCSFGAHPFSLLVSSHPLLCFGCLRVSCCAHATGTCPPPPPTSAWTVASGGAAARSDRPRTLRRSVPRASVTDRWVRRCAVGLRCLSCRVLCCCVCGVCGDQYRCQRFARARSIPSTVHHTHPPALSHDHKGCTSFVTRRHDHRHHRYRRAAVAAAAHHYRLCAHCRCCRCRY